MRFFNKHGVALPTETLVIMLALTMFLVIGLGLILMVTGVITVESVSETVCWMSNHIQASSFVTQNLLSSGCSFTQKTEAQDLKGISKLITQTWWMYGEGKLDFGVAKDEIYTVYAFTIKDEVNITNLIYIYNYLLTHALGSTSTSEKSDYNYLQENAKGPTLCFEKKSLYVEKGKTYFILFLDDQRPKEYGDKVIISSTLLKGTFDNPTMYACYSPVENKWVLGSLKWGSMSGA